jgi:predicted transcriptional regulator
VIGESGFTAGTVHDAEILALLSRRPCTAREVSEELGLGAREAAARIERLARAGSLRTIGESGAIFYETVEIGW